MHENVKNISLFKVWPNVHSLGKRVQKLPPNADMGIKTQYQNAKVLEDEEKEEEEMAEKFSLLN